MSVNSKELQKLIHDICVYEVKVVQPLMDVLDYRTMAFVGELKVRKEMEALKNG